MSFIDDIWVILCTIYYALPKASDKEFESILGIAHQLLIAEWKTLENDDNKFVHIP